MVDMLNFVIVPYSITVYSPIVVLILSFCYLFVRRKMGMRHRPLYSLGNSLFSDFISSF